MALPEVTGRFDGTLGYIVPKTSSRWQDLTSSTWASFTSWLPVPADPLVWISNVIDLGEIIDFTITIDSVYTGIIEYDIYTSETGYFGGEEIKTAITRTTTTVPSLYGRYALVAAKVYRSQDINTLRSLTFTAQRKAVELIFPNIDSSSLDGDMSGRILNLGRSVSKILTMSVIGRDTGGTQSNEYFIDDYIEIGYVRAVNDLYVDTGYFSDDTGYVGPSVGNMSWPFVVSKSATAPTFCIRDQYGDYIDGTVDVIIKALPEQYIVNGQLKTR